MTINRTDVRNVGIMWDMTDGKAVMTDEQEAPKAEKAPLVGGKDAKGRFAKGNSFKPPTAHRRRQPLLSDVEQALAENFGPEHTVRILQDIFDRGSLRLQLDTL